MRARVVWRERKEVITIVQAQDSVSYHLNFGTKEME